MSADGDDIRASLQATARTPSRSADTRAIRLAVRDRRRRVAVVAGGAAIVVLASGFFALREPESDIVAAGPPTSSTTTSDPGRSPSSTSGVTTTSGATTTSGPTSTNVPRHTATEDDLLRIVADRTALQEGREVEGLPPEIAATGGRFDVDVRDGAIVIFTVDPTPELESAFESHYGVEVEVVDGITAPNPG